MSKIKIAIPELLAPAGNLEKMKIAFEFGADAVYFGLPDFSLRVRINQFDEKAIIEASQYCKNYGKKFYVTLNIYAHQRHLEELPKHLELIKKIKPDGVIVSDPGILSVVRRELPDQEIHLSTQANATNSEAVKFWSRQGVSRVILAREVTLEEIKQIKKEAPEMELEYFIHGAMCMSYSGRCILSKWMTGRSANLGDCAQPCRWKFHRITNHESRIMNQRFEAKSLEVEGEKPLVGTVIDDQGMFKVDLEEDKHGTYFFNSKDLCLIEHAGELMEAGVDSLKIEGRAKSVYYVAVVVRAYRKIIDAFAGQALSEKQRNEVVRQQKEELLKLSNRGYTTGFLLGDQPEHLFSESSIKTNWIFTGIAQDQLKAKKRRVFVHNKVDAGDEVELINPEKNEKTKIVSIFDEQGRELNSAHGGQGKYYDIVYSSEIGGCFLMRKSQN